MNIIKINAYSISRFIMSTAESTEKGSSSHTECIHSSLEIINSAHHSTSVNLF